MADECDQSEGPNLVFACPFQYTWLSNMGMRESWIGYSSSTRTETSDREGSNFKQEFPNRKAVYLEDAFA